MGSKINTLMKVKLPYWLPPAPRQSLVFLAFDWTQKRLLMGSPLWASRGPHSRHIFKRRVQLLVSDRKSKFLNLALVLGGLCAKIETRVRESGHNKGMHCSV